MGGGGSGCSESEQAAASNFSSESKQSAETLLNPAPSAPHPSRPHSFATTLLLGLRAPFALSGCARRLRQAAAPGGLRQAGCSHLFEERHPELVRIVTVRKDALALGIARKECVDGDFAPLAKFV